jgi:ZIP family zinc transporter
MPIQDVLVSAVFAGVLASLACGLGALPLLIRRFDPARHRGLGYAVAGGLVFSASVYNLILPGLGTATGGWSLRDVAPIVAGILLGAGFLALAESRLSRHTLKRTSDSLDGWGGRIGLLVFLAMTVHSIPEGVAVGVGYASDAVGQSHDGLGPTLAVAIAIHNIPEGLAVAIPLRSSGSSVARCFLAAVVTSLPQPIAAVAAVPAVLLTWFFKPLMSLFMDFAAGAMIFLIILELIPAALETETPLRITWAFTLGFCAMLMIQVVL